VLTLASDSSAGKLYEAFHDRHGYGRIAVRASLGHHQLPISRHPGEVWGIDAALVVLQDLGHRGATVELAEQLLTEVIDPLPYDGWTLTEDTLRSWLSKQRSAQ
jgi:hypothetical protein